MTIDDEKINRLKKQINNEREQNWIYSPVDLGISTELRWTVDMNPNG